MWQRIQENLTRQSKGLEVLKTLLKEEFSLLAERKTNEVSAIEFSIHELLRQLVVEREELRTVLKGKRLKDRLIELPEEEAQAVRELLRVVDQAEQTSARQASRNAELVLALHDQSTGLLEFMHNKLNPERKEAYSKKGRYTNSRPEATLVRGHL